MQRFGIFGPPYLHKQVVRFSAHNDCTHAVADALAGEDYDGDTALITEYQPMVSLFCHTPFDEDIVEMCMARFENKHKQLPTW